MGELLDKTFGPVVHRAPSTNPKTKGVLYDIRRSARGDLRCSCDGFLYRQTCHHVREYAASLAAAQEIR